MTAQPTEPTSQPVLSGDVLLELRALIGSLAAAAGDAQQVRQVLRDALADVGPDDGPDYARDLAVSCLYVTFTECVSVPVAPGDTTPLVLPTPLEGTP